MLFIYICIFNFYIYLKKLNVRVLVFFVIKFLNVGI